MRAGARLRLRSHQALTWSWKRAPVLFYGPVMVMLGIMLAFRLVGLSPQDILSLTGRTLREPQLWALVPPLLLLFMTLGVYLERQDRYFGPTRVSALFTQVSQWLSPSLKASAMPFEAQLWYEMRRVSSLLPGLTLLFTALFVLVMVLVEEHPLGSGLGQYVPLAALMAAGLVSGFKGMFPRSSLQNLRPMEDKDIAVARMLASCARVPGRASCGSTVAASVAGGPVEPPFSLNYRRKVLSCLRCVHRRHEAAGFGGDGDVGVVRLNAHPTTLYC